MYNFDLGVRLCFVTFFWLKKFLSLEKKKFSILISDFFLAKKVLSLEKKKYEYIAKNATVVNLIVKMQNLVFLWGKKTPKSTKRGAVEMRMKNLKFVDFENLLL